MKTHRPALLLAAALALSVAACSKTTPEVVPVPMPTPMTPVPSVAAAASDTEVTTLVKTALLRDDDTKAFDVAVVTTKGDVRLTGVMDTQMQIDRALSVVRAVTGVNAVQNELTLKK